MCTLIMYDIFMIVHSLITLSTSEAMDAGAGEVRQGGWSYVGAGPPHRAASVSLPPGPRFPLRPPDSASHIWPELADVPKPPGASQQGAEANRSP